MTFSLFLQNLINGLNQGAIYALIALGYTMVYGIIRMINFAHGDFIMIGAYTLFYTIPLMVNAGMPAWLSVIGAVAVCAAVGVLVETVAYRPVRKAGSMSALITAMAMSIFLENLAMVLFGARPHNVQKIFNFPSVSKFHSIIINCQPGFFNRRFVTIFKQTFLIDIGRNDTVNLVGYLHIQIVSGLCFRAYLRVPAIPKKHTCQKDQKTRSNDYRHEKKNPILFNCFFRNRSFCFITDRAAASRTKSFITV